MPWREFGPPSALAAPPVISAANVFERLDPAAQSRARRYEALLLLRSTVEEKPESAALGGGISAGR